MYDELIQQARDLCEKTTPGPWSIDFNEPFSEDINGIFADKQDKYVFYIETDDCDAILDNDAAFIAASRTLVPQLCDALEAAQKELVDYHHTQKVADGKTAENARLRRINEQLTARAEKAEAENRWIPVSERLPEPGERVLICFDGGFVCEGYHKGLAWDRYNNPLGTIEEWMGSNVTHWRPLPEPPKGDRE